MRPGVSWTDSLLDWDFPWTFLFTGVGLLSLARVIVVNLSVLKNGRARAVRFSTLTAVCRAPDCQPGDLLSVRSARR